MTVGDEVCEDQKPEITVRDRKRWAAIMDSMLHTRRRIFWIVWSLWVSRKHCTIGLVPCECV